MKKTYKTINVANNEEVIRGTNWSQVNHLTYEYLMREKDINLNLQILKETATGDIILNDWVVRQTWNGNWKMYKKSVSDRIKITKERYALERTKRAEKHTEKNEVEEVITPEVIVEEVKPEIKTETEVVIMEKSFEEIKAEIRRQKKHESDRRYREKKKAEKFAKIDKVLEDYRQENK
jgi:hypothetical protein